MTKVKIPKQAFTLSPALLSHLESDDVWQTFQEMDDAGLARPPYDEFDILVPCYWTIGENRESHRKFLIEHASKMPDPENALRSLDNVDVFQFRVGRSIVPAESLKSVYYKFACLTSSGRIVTPSYFAIEWTPLGSEEALKASRGETPLPHIDSNDMPPGYVATEHLIALRANRHKRAHLAYALLTVCLVSKGLEKKTVADKLAKLGIGRKGATSRHIYTTHIGFPNESDGSGEKTGITIRPHFRRGHVRQQHFGTCNSLTKQIFIEPVWVNMALGDPAPRDHYSVNRSLTGISAGPIE